MCKKIGINNLKDISTKIILFILIISFVTVNTNAQIMRAEQKRNIGITCKSELDKRQETLIRKHIVEDMPFIKNKVASIYSALGCVSTVIVTLIMGLISYDNDNWAILWSPAISIVLSVLTVNGTLQSIVNNIFLNDYEMLVIEAAEKRGINRSTYTTAPFIYTSAITYLVEIAMIIIIGILYLISCLIWAYILFTASN